MMKTKVISITVAVMMFLTVFALSMTVTNAAEQAPVASSDSATRDSASRDSASKDSSKDSAGSDTNGAVATGGSTVAVVAFGTAVAGAGAAYVLTARKKNH